MAGTLTAGTLSDGTNSASTTDAIKGSARAWVNFNGITGAIRASYNVSSVIRSSTGAYTVNLTNALSDTNYSVSGSAGSLTTNTACWFGIGSIAGSWPVNNTTSSFRVQVTYATGNAADTDYVCAVVNR